jgi:hypothetical protein
MLCANQQGHSNEEIPVCRGGGVFAVCRTLPDETVEALWLKLDALKLVPKVGVLA